MNDFEEHLKLLLFFSIALFITFLVAFSLNIERLWVALIFVMVIVVGIIIVLARFGRME